MTDPEFQQAEALMQAFAHRTGLTSDATPRRYLWTDAFAVCCCGPIAIGVVSVPLTASPCSNTSLTSPCSTKDLNWQ